MMDCGGDSWGAGSLGNLVNKLRQCSKIKNLDLSLELTKINGNVDGGGEVGNAGNSGCIYQQWHGQTCDIFLLDGLGLDSISPEVVSLHLPLKGRCMEITEKHLQQSMLSCVPCGIQSFMKQSI